MIRWETIFYGAFCVAAILLNLRRGSGWRIALILSVDCLASNATFYRFGYPKAFDFFPLIDLIGGSMVMAAFRACRTKSASLIGGLYLIRLGSMFAYAWQRRSGGDASAAFALVVAENACFIVQLSLNSGDGARHVLEAARSGLFGRPRRRYVAIARRE